MKKEMHKNRVITDFIKATDELIHDEGIESITLRKVARKAGYNSATLYNYFENLQHLVFFSAMRLIKDYADALKVYTADSENAMDRFLKVWECFCDYSYDKPEIYNAIFFSNLNKDVEDYVEEYYKLFPEDLQNADYKTSTMLLKTDITERGMTTVADCINEGYIKPEDGDRLNDMTLIIYEGMLKRVLAGRINYDDARHQTMDYIKSIVRGLLIKDYEFYY